MRYLLYIVGALFMVLVVGRFAAAYAMVKSTDAIGTGDRPPGGARRPGVMSPPEDAIITPVSRGRSCGGSCGT